MAFGYCWVNKGVKGHSIGDVEFRGDLLAVYLVEETQVHMEACSWTHMLSGNGCVAGEMRTLVNVAIFAKML